MIQSIYKKDINKILASVYGNKFLEYRAKWEKADSLEYSLPFPLHIDVETTGRCNLRCKMCNRQLDPNFKPRGGLSREELRIIIDEGSREGCYSLLYGNDDEPLLDPDKFLYTAEYALSKGFCDVWLGTNGIKLTKDLSREIIKLKLPRITISIDAASAKTYQAIRRSNKYDEIIDNIENFIRIRRELGASLPILRLSFVIMDENSHEKDLFHKTWDNKAEIIMFQDLMDMTVDIDALTSEDKRKLYEEGDICWQPFKRLSVEGDGYVYPCCNLNISGNTDFALGNIRDNTLKELWDSAKMARLRKNLKERKFDEIGECLKCRAMYFKST